MSQLTFYLHKLFDKQALSKTEAGLAAQIILDQANAEQTSAFLTLLKYRGEQPEEIIGILEALEKNAISIQLPHPVMDIVGTGGDLANTVNISTGSAILAAACGIPIVKHGNRAVSSQCGSADVLEALGININMSIAQIKNCLNKINLAFLYAPNFHPALKKLKTIRKKIGIPTLFNLLGPLLNPAKAEFILLGVADENRLELISDVVTKMSHIKKALVFHGNGLDELTTLGKITAYEIQHGEKQQLTINPNELGFTPCQLHELAGKDVTTNAALLLAGLEGKHSAIADACILNAGAALMTFGNVTTLREGVDFAREQLYQGKALELLEEWILLSNQQES